ncbi:hypothetical protein B1813_06080 [Saccharomonospora piscinae]|uniref:DUF3558 domain-containing protein n=1 Tax=Saccharomonospora piscinae TaxID=687388 RepID=A0A1V9AAI1_SACPI|nr:DUF3558 family protein [Saccharomonospora piscinae]OQO94068.1 hypothetical protein B1813_06080 [Saccharomonospora piscinae]
MGEAVRVRPVAALLAGAVLAGAGACGTGERVVGPASVGDSGAGPVASAPATARSGTAAQGEFDPCSLLGPADRSSAGLAEAGERATVGGSPACDYVQPGDFGLLVTLDHHTDLDLLRERSPEAEEVRVGAVTALRVADLAADDGTCAVLLPAGGAAGRSGARSVHVDVTLTDFQDTRRACTRALAVAELIEPELT